MTARYPCRAVSCDEPATSTGDEAAKPPACTAGHRRPDRLASVVWVRSSGWTCGWGVIGLSCVWAAN